MDTAIAEPTTIVYEVWDKVRRCVLGCFTSHEAAAQFVEPNGLSECCEIREYALD